MMKNRVIKKVEKRLIVEKVCELQHKIDEYERFLGDLLIMLAKRQPQAVLQHDAGDFSNWIWDETRKLIKENADLREKAGIGAESAPEHPAGRAD
jgi:ADP-dependent phosphofructokinase/glucokinase